MEGRFYCNLANFKGGVILNLSRARLRREESPVGVNRFLVHCTVAELVEACGGLGMTFLPNHYYLKEPENIAWMRRNKLPYRSR